MSRKNNNPGYHLREIKPGQLGELSKVREELEEAVDAEEQECKIMQSVELSDLCGAVDAYCQKHLQCSLESLVKSDSNCSCELVDCQQALFEVEQSITPEQKKKSLSSFLDKIIGYSRSHLKLELKDLLTMSKITTRAFESGRRKSSVEL